MNRITAFSSLIFILLGAAMANTSMAGNAPKTSISSQQFYATGSQQSFKGPEKYFTGDVQVEMVFPANQNVQYSAAYVTFQSGARTAWHSHPAGQHMIITAGTGVTGTRDGNMIRFKAGESVWCPPNIDHWHGAAGDKPMTHLVITGSKDGENVLWKEQVTDSQVKMMD